MAKRVKPQAFLIAQTATDYHQMQEAIRSCNSEVTWDSDAARDAALLTEFAGKLCYMSFDTALNANLTKTGGRTNAEYIAEGILANKHGSVLEHATATFCITNVSRVVTHELVRHRAGTAFSQTSGRYVRDGELKYYLPQDIARDKRATALFESAFEDMETGSLALAALTGIEKATFAVKKRLTSAFRRLIGNGASNNIVVTANHRAWRHMIEMRTDPSAEEEIRVVMADISRKLRAEFPEIYCDAIVTLDSGIEVTRFANSHV